MLNSNLNRWVQWGWAGLWGIAMLALLILASFNHPSLDDYNYAILAQEKGLLQSQLLWYHDWSGRYFSNLMLSLSPLTFHSFSGYKILTAVLLVAFFGILCWFIYHLSEAGSNRRNILSLCSLCCLLYCLTLPTFSEGFYWMPAAITYHLPAILTLIFLVLCRKLERPGPSVLQKAGMLMISALLLIAIAGSNELSLISIIYLIGVIVIYHYRKTRKLSPILASWLILTLLCAVFALSSPGNANRSTLFSEDLSLASTFWKAGRNLVSFLGRCILPFTIFGVLAGVPWWMSLSKKESKPAPPWLYMHPLLSVALLISLLYLLFWAGWYATRAPLIARAENVPFFWLFLGWLWIVRNTVFYLKKSGRRLPEKALKISYGLALLCSVYFFVRENNLRSAVGDLALNRAFTYDRQMLERTSLIENCKSDTCTIPTLEVKPVLLYIGSFQDPAMPEQNKSWCRYFGKKAIIESPREQDQPGH